MPLLTDFLDIFWEMKRQCQDGTSSSLEVAFTGTFGHVPWKCTLRVRHVDEHNDHHGGMAEDIHGGLSASRRATRSAVPLVEGVATYQDQEK